MTSKEIREAIKRLKAMPRDNILSNWGVVTGFMNVPKSGSFSTFELRERLIDLLEMADPETHVELPRDADGVPIRIGDELECLGYDDVWEKPFEVKELWLGHSGWRAYNSHAYSRLSERCRHHHKPTVEDMLRMFLAESEDAMRKGYDEVPNEIYVRYAAKLREILEVSDD